MEGHHLIPCDENSKSKEKFGRNIVAKKILSLCPTCHRAIHMGNADEKGRNMTKLISAPANSEKIGINITENT